MQLSKPVQPLPKIYAKKLFLKCALVFVGGIVFTALILFFSLQYEPVHSYGQGFNMLSMLKREVLVKSIVIYSLTLFLIITGIIAITLLYSHRIVGPMYRLKMSMKVISGGDCSGKTYLREKDVIHSLADELNSLVNCYRTLLCDLKEKSNVLHELTTQEDSGKLEEPEKLRAETRKAINELAERVETIKL